MHHGLGGDDGVARARSSTTVSRAIRIGHMMLGAERRAHWTKAVPPAE
jgi:hypothetical protein